jgi:hypothetical protein
LGPDPDKDWLLRYDYVPDEPANDPEYEYPVAHVHFNGVSKAYDRLGQAKNRPLHKLHCPTERITIEDFIEHLIIEFDALTGETRTAALAFMRNDRLLPLAVQLPASKSGFLLRRFRPFDSFVQTHLQCFSAVRRALGPLCTSCRRVEFGANDAPKARGSASIRADHDRGLGIIRSS